VADSICALLGARASALYRTGPGGELLALATSRSGSFDWAPVLAPGTGMAGLAVRERQPVAGPDVLTDTRLHYEPALRESLATNPDRALLGAPLIVRDRLLGALAVADRTGRVFDTEDTRLAQAFADQAALALENAGLYRETEQRRREAEELARLAGSLTESLETDAMAARIAESVVTLFSVQSSVIRRLRPDGALVALASAGRAREIAEPGHVLPPGTGTSGRAVQRGAAVTTTQIFDDSDVNLTDELREQIARVGDAAQLAVPMRAEGRTIGSLSISDRAGRIFSEAETRLLQAFADQAALALENARLYAETMRRRQEAEELARLAQTLTESLDVSAEGIPLGTLPSTGFSIKKACPMVDGQFQNVTEDENRNPKVKVTDPQCGPNYHTDVTGIASLNFAQDVMKQILATPGPAFPDVTLTASGGVARLKVFAVTLTYTVPEPASLVLLAAGAAWLAAATPRRWRRR
jgi:GAF domain-containing protein